MTTWRAGRRLVLARLASQAIPLGSFLATCEEAPEARVSGTAVLLTTQTENVPLTLLNKSYASGRGVIIMNPASSSV